jgi:hypothetical protein
MLKKLNVLFVTCVLFLSANAFAEEGQYECSNNPTSYDNSFTYVKLGAGVQKQVGPAIGIGRRFGMDDAAVDLSINWMGSHKSGYFSCPKVMYLRYLNPYSPNSLYYGAGLSLGSSGSKNMNFAGLQGELTVGYEMHRCSKFRTFVSLDVSQGIVAFRSKDNRFAPAAALTFGVGF